MNLNSNKGKYLESIINNSILYYELNEIALFRKNYPQYKILKVTNNNFLGKFIQKADVDYYGVYNGHFICFEAKQTSKEKFSLNNIMEHQDKFLKQIILMGGKSFLILHFICSNEFFKIDYSKIIDYKMKSIDKEWCKKNGITLEVLFPGRIEII